MLTINYFARNDDDSNERQHESLRFVRENEKWEREHEIEARRLVAELSRAPAGVYRD